MFETRMRFSRQGPARFISHLDMMHTMQRAFARSGLPVWFTEGFNPHAYVSLLLPLPTGFESGYEIMDFRLTEQLLPGRIADMLSPALPPGIAVKEIYLPEMGPRDIGFAGFDVTLYTEGEEGAALAPRIDQLLGAGGPLMTVKKARPSKPAENVDVRDFIASCGTDLNPEGLAVIKLVLAAGGRSLSPVYVVQALKERGADRIVAAKYTRTAIFDRNGALFR